MPQQRNGKIGQIGMVGRFKTALIASATPPPITVQNSIGMTAMRKISCSIRSFYR